MICLYQISRIGCPIEEKVNYRSPESAEREEFRVTANKHHVFVIVENVWK